VPSLQSALQMREELSLGKYVTSTPPSDRGVTWESVRTLLAQRLTSKAASQVRAPSHRRRWKRCG